MTPDLKSREHARQRLRAQGITIAQFAREYNHPVAEVYRVLSGKYHGYYGRAHQIAVDLKIIKSENKRAA